MKSLNLALGIIASFAGLAVISSFIIPSAKAPQVPLGYSLDADLGISDETAATELALKQPEEHPVTNEMIKAAESLGSDQAPDFTLISTDGTSYIGSNLWKDKPVLIFFIEKECPCCLGAKHFFDKLADLYKGNVVAIGIINTDDQEAQKWVTATRPRFPVLQDPNQKTISAYKAERGVYTTLIRPGGIIERAYPGYSLEMLKDLSTRIAKNAGVRDKGFESDAAPTKMTSGCLFPEPPTETEN